MDENSVNCDKKSLTIKNDSGLQQPDGESESNLLFGASEYNEPDGDADDFLKQMEEYAAEENLREKAAQQMEDDY